MSDLLPTTKNLLIIQVVEFVADVAVAKLASLIIVAPDKIPALPGQWVPGDTLPVTGS